MPRHSIALQPDTPTVEGDDGARQRQTQASAAETTGSGAIHLMEEVEDPRQLVRGNTDTTIGNGEPDLIVAPLDLQ